MLNLQLQQPPSFLQVLDTAFDVGGQRRLAHLRNLTLKGVGLHGSMQADSDTVTSLGLAAFPTLELLDLSENPGITGSLPDLLAGRKVIHVAWQAMTLLVVGHSRHACSHVFWYPCTLLYLGVAPRMT
jgi:hypothetical protein